MQHVTHGGRAGVQARRPSSSANLRLDHVYLRGPPPTHPHYTHTHTHTHTVPLLQERKAEEAARKRAELKKLQAEEEAALAAASKKKAAKPAAPKVRLLLCGLAPQLAGNSTMICLVWARDCRCRGCPMRDGAARRCRRFVCLLRLLGRRTATQPTTRRASTSGRALLPRLSPTSQARLPGASARR